MTKTLLERPQNAPKTKARTATVKVRGETYNSVWINNELRQMINELQANQQIRTKIQLFASKSYTKNKWDYWLRQNGKTPRTAELQQKVDEILEARLIEQGFEARNPAFTIFLLKNNYGYTDNRTVTNEGTVVFTVTRGIASPPKRKQIPGNTTSVSKH